MIYKFYNAFVQGVMAAGSRHLKIAAHSGNDAAAMDRYLANDSVMGNETQWSEAIFRLLGWLLSFIQR